MTQILKYHVRLNRERWEVVREGHQQPLADFATKNEAIEWGRTEASKIGIGRLFIHRDDGSVDEELNYVDESVVEEESPVEER